MNRYEYDEPCITTPTMRCQRCGLDGEVVMPTQVFIEWMCNTPLEEAWPDHEREVRQVLTGLCVEHNDEGSKA